MLELNTEIVSSSKDKQAPNQHTKAKTQGIQNPVSAFKALINEPKAVEELFGISTKLRFLTIIIEHLNLGGDSTDKPTSGLNAQYIWCSL